MAHFSENGVCIKLQAVAELYNIICKNKAGNGCSTRNRAKGEGLN